MNAASTVKLSHKIKRGWGYDGFGARALLTYAEIRFNHGGAQVLIKCWPRDDTIAWSMNAGMRITTWDLREIYDYIRAVQLELDVI